MTPKQASASAAFAAASFFLVIVAFNYGRLTASEVHLRSACDLSADQREELKANWYMSNVYVEPDRR